MKKKLVIDCGIEICRNNPQCSGKAQLQLATRSAARLTSWDIHETSTLYSTISCYNKHLLLTVFHLQPRGAYLSERSQTESLFVLPQICRLLEIEKRQLVNISLPHSFASVCTQMRLFRHRCSLMTTYRATHQWVSCCPTACSHSA